MTDVPGICAELAELQGFRLAYLKMLLRLDNQARALARRYLGWRYDLSEAERDRINARAARLVAAVRADKPLAAGDAEIAAALRPHLAALAAAGAPIAGQLADTEKAMARAARELPAYAWVRETGGVSALGLAVIVAEAGDLARYDGPRKLRKRLGLAPYKGHAGKTWAIQKWRPRALTSAEWVDYGYSGRRRAQVWGFVDQNVERAIARLSPAFKALYQQEKARFAAKGASPVHAQNHARRVVAQQLMLDLWRVWHGLSPRDRSHLTQPAAVAA
jgi:hypothetical protein